MEQLERLARLTFDTSCIISLLGQDNTPNDELGALHQIQQWHEKGRVEIWISEKSRTEALLNLEIAQGKGDVGGERERKWIDTLARLANYPVTQGIWILGVSRLGIDTVLGSDEQARDYDEMIADVFRETPLSERETGDVFDMAILFEHYLQGNTLFVTRDRKHILKPQVKASLREKWGVRVVDPLEAADVLRSENGLE